MNFYEVPGEGYIPTYIRTDFTDALHEAFGFHTDYQIVSTKQMKKILKDFKKQKTLLTFYEYYKKIESSKYGGLQPFYLLQLSNVRIDSIICELIFK